MFLLDSAHRGLTVYLGIANSTGAEIRFPSAGSGWRLGNNGTQGPQELNSMPDITTPNPDGYPQYRGPHGKERLVAGDVPDVTHVQKDGQYR
ncbi:hypothetical protein SAMN05446934_1979 [Paraburkholderia hospita]|nr:hypothetical protein SAMN05446934_1979 [Paraburkholderia hospita]